MALFTVETARQAGLTSARRQAERKALAARAPVTEPLPTPETTETIRSIELSRVQKKLETLNRLMDEASTDLEWDRLSKSYDRIFKAWMVLAAIPGSGHRRPAPERSKPSRPGSPLAEE